MNPDLHVEKSRPSFGAKAASLTLLVVLVAFILADYVLQSLLQQLQSTDGLLSLQQKSPNEIGALRAALTGLINPAVILTTVALMLRFYFPNESLQSWCARFGCIGRPANNILILSFFVGVVYIVFFSVLMRLIPPAFPATPNPANVINYGSFFEKALFAVTAIALVPIAEEFLFRGVLYQGIANSWGKVVSSICVSIIFVLLHPESIESGYWVTHLTLYIFPLCMICLREATGTLYSAMAAHAGFNFTEIFF